MIQDTQQGRFWLPDKPEGPVPGTLRLRSEGRLELTTSHVENNLRDTFLPYFEKGNRPRTIAGVTNGGNIALIEATPLGRKTSLNTYLVETQQTWDCGLCLAEQILRTHSPGEEHPLHRGEYPVPIRLGTGQP